MPWYPNSLPIFQATTVNEGAAGAGKEVDSRSGPSQPTGDHTPPRTLDAEKADYQLSSEYCIPRIQFFHPPSFPIFIAVASICCFYVLLKTLKPFFFLSFMQHESMIKSISLNTTVILQHLQHYRPVQLNFLLLICLILHLLTSPCVSAARDCHSEHSVVNTLRLERTTSSEHVTVYSVSSLSVLTFSCASYAPDPAMWQHRKWWDPRSEWNEVWGSSDTNRKVTKITFDYPVPCLCCHVLLHLCLFVTPQPHSTSSVYQQYGSTCQPHAAEWNYRIWKWFDCTLFWKCHESLLPSPSFGCIV